MSLGHKQDAVIITQWECLAMRFRPRGQRAMRTHTLAVVAGGVRVTGCVAKVSVQD